MLDLLKFLDARMGEPSTYAGLSALMLAAHVNIDPGVMHQLTLWGTCISAGLAAVLSEVGKKAPTQLVTDGLAAFVAALKASAPPTAP